MKKLVPVMAALGATLGCQGGAKGFGAASDDGTIGSQQLGAKSTALPAASARAAKDSKPPFEKFGLKPWTGFRADQEPINPPKSLLVPWRAMVTQERPRQKKNPPWQTLPPDKAVELQFIEQSKHRCIVNPLVIEGRPDEDHDGVEAWMLTRHIVCSGDGWQTWTDTPHTMYVSLDGQKIDPREQTNLFLREPRGNQVIETIVKLRTDKRGDKKAPTDEVEEGIPGLAAKKAEVIKKSGGKDNRD